MSKFSTEICLLCMILFNGTQCETWTRVYTTPGSVLRLNMIDLEESVHCYFYPTGQEFKKRIINASREYDAKKYQLITSIISTITIQAPQEIGKFASGLHILELERKKLHITDKSLSSENEIYGPEGSNINLTFTLNTTRPLSGRSLRLDEDAVKYIFQFNLKIKKTSSEDSGIYKCLVVTPWIDIVVAPIRFLYQTDDNMIYGQEERAMNITCETVPGHSHEKLYIKHNGTTLTANTSNTVTFHFRPDRHDDFKEFECTGRQELPVVRVKLIVNFAPDVQVIALEHSLNCIATGFPQTYTFKKWEHQSEQGEHIRFLKGLPNGTLNLETLKLKYQISGRYVCTVSNGIPDVNGSVLQKGFESLQYTGHLVFASENRKVKVVQLYKPITLTFLLYSDPIVERIIMRGVAASHEINKTIHDYSISRTDLMYTEFGKKGNIEGYKVSFDCKIFSDDYKMYNIWAGNGIGEDSFSFEIQAIGEPIFVPENRNLKHGELDHSLLMTFVLYSNPIMEEIWINSNTSWNSHKKTKDVFKISKTTLPYTVFGNQGNISAYEIIFETKNLKSHDFHEYYIWAKNKLGVDFYRFEILEIDTLKNNGKYNTRFITSTCIGAGLFVNLLIVLLCVRLKRKSVCSRQRTTTEEIHYHTYDEIGYMPHQAVTITNLVVNQERPSQPNRIFQTTDINNQMPLTDRPETLSSVFTEYPGNETHQNLASEDSEMSSALSDENIMHRYGDCIEEENFSSDDSLQSSQRRRNQCERSSITNGTSASSTDSEESKFDSLKSTSVDINFGDGYENPYQIIVQEIQDTHQYSSIIHTVEKMGDTDYVNL